MAASDVLGAVADKYGIEAPSDWGSVTEINARQLRAALNDAGRAVARRYRWQGLRREATWTSVAAEDQGAIGTIISADQPHWMLGGSMWNRTEQEQLGRPLSAEEFQALQASTITSPYYDVYIRGGHLFLTPAPPAGQEMALSYQTRYWCSAAGESDATKEVVTAATDLLYLDEFILELQTAWRYLQARGLDYSEAFNTAEQHLSENMMRDGSTKGVRQLAGAFDHRPRGVRAPAGSWNLT